MYQSGCSLLQEQEEFKASYGAMKEQSELDVQFQISKRWSDWFKN
jgi:hypothetical protein